MPESVQETVRTHLERGRAWFEMGKYDRAIADYTNAIALIPDMVMDVRFTPKSGHSQRRHRCPLSAISGHRRIKPPRRS